MRIYIRHAEGRDHHILDVICPPSIGQCLAKSAAILPRMTLSPFTPHPQFPFQYHVSVLFHLVRTLPAAHHSHFHKPHDSPWRRGLVPGTPRTSNECTRRASRAGRRRSAAYSRVTGTLRARHVCVARGSLKSASSAQRGPHGGAAKDWAKPGPRVMASRNTE